MKLRRLAIVVALCAVACLPLRYFERIKYDNLGFKGNRSTRIVKWKHFGFGYVREADHIQLLLILIWG